MVNPSCWCPRREADEGHRETAQRAIAVGEDRAAGTSAGPAREDARHAAEGPSSEGQREEQGQDPSAPEGSGMDMEAHSEAALAKIMAATSPPNAEAIEEDGKGQERSRRVEEPGEEEEGLEITGAQEAHEVERGETEVADKAEPKTGEVETCRHYAKGWYLRAHACRFAHPQPPLPQGVPQDLLLLLQAIARVGALNPRRSDHHDKLLLDVVEAAEGGGDAS